MPSSTSFVMCIVFGVLLLIVTIAFIIYASSCSSCSLCRRRATTLLLIDDSTITTTSSPSSPSSSGTTTTLEEHPIYTKGISVLSLENDMISRHVRGGYAWEFEIAKEMADRIVASGCKDSIVIDVGANLGLLSIGCFLNLPPEYQQNTAFLAVEMQPDVATVLIDNFRRYFDHFKVVVAGVSNNASEGKLLTFNRNNDNVGGTSLNKTHEEQNNDENRINVPATTLASIMPLLDPQRRCIVCKVDIEGHEPMIFDETDSDASSFWRSKHRPETLFIEIHDEMLNEMTHLLNLYDYDIVKRDGHDAVANTK
jgi:FkbM family methyltransferase